MFVTNKHKTLLILHLCIKLVTEAEIKPPTGVLNRMLEEKLYKMCLDLKYIWVSKVLQLQYRCKK